MNCEVRGNAAVAWLKGTKNKLYEDRYRLLSQDVPLIRRLERGQMFAVFDGIETAPEGRRPAQEMGDTIATLCLSG
jgi:PPM family protein phosphatase